MAGRAERSYACNRSVTEMNSVCCLQLHAVAIIIIIVIIIILFKSGNTAQYSVSLSVIPSHTRDTTTIIIFCPMVLHSQGLRNYQIIIMKIVHKVHKTMHIQRIDK